MASFFDMFAPARIVFLTMHWFGSLFETKLMISGRWCRMLTQWTRATFIENGNCTVPNKTVPVAPCYTIKLLCIMLPLVCFLWATLQV